jgi:hypothetical protein
MKEEKKRKNPEWIKKEKKRIDKKKKKEFGNFPEMYKKELEKICKEC